MKTIFFLRHAKSSWKDAGQADIDRPLNERGKADAPMMGKRFKKNGIQPQLIISSPARRAFKTAGIIAKELDYNTKNIQVNEGLYEADTNYILQLLKELPEELDTVMLVGHNPTFTYMAGFLSEEHILELPTCGLIRIDYNTGEWGQIEPGKGKFMYMDFPKNI